MEFASYSDEKEAVAKSANLLFVKYYLGRDQKVPIFIESHITEALKTVGWFVSICSFHIDFLSFTNFWVLTSTENTKCFPFSGSGGPDPDLLLVYGPARCHLGFPAWRIRYTEIV